MTDTSHHCSYVYDGFPPYRCLWTAHGGDKCILHSPLDGKDENAFLATLRGKIKADSEDTTTDAIHLEGVVFPAPFRWRGATEDVEVRKPVRFFGATFTGYADFSGATFTGDARFWGAIFTGNASFWGAIFTGDADFFGAIFTGDADFFGATFTGDASFFRATFTGFTGVASFSEATFTGVAIFSEATFTGVASFFRATFTGVARFSGATFRQRLAFQSLNRGEQDATGRSRAVPLDFSYVILEQPQLVSFEDVDLSKASFLYTNLSQVRFIAITWARKEERLWLFPLVETNHNAIGDHMELERRWKSLASDRRQQQAALVADVYRQLRLNLEGTRQEIEAAHFFIGQMDMRLKDSSIPRRHRWPLRLYRGIAMYGESWYRPLWVHVLLGLLFGFVYLLGGFIWSDMTFHYNRFDLSAGLPVAAYLRALFLALTPGGLLSGGFRVISPWLLPLQLINTISVPFLFGLTLIALRRQFRR